MPKYRITHSTTYRYSAPVVVSRHTGYLKPLDAGHQETEAHHLRITPHPTELIERIDFFGNTQAQFQIEDRHEELNVTAESHVWVSQASASDLGSGRTCQDIRNLLRAETSKTAMEAYIMTTPTGFTQCGRALEEFAFDYLSPGRPYLEGALALNEAIFEGFEFDPEATDLGTPADEVFQHRRGVCQDFAHLMLACLRSQRLPARYVSGYLLTEPPEGGVRLQGADASHAWVSVWSPDAGWVDLDPTNNICCGDEHVTVARGRDYADVNPLRGAVTGGGKQQMEVAVTMEPEEKS